MPTRKRQSIQPNLPVTTPMQTADGAMSRSWILALQSLFNGPPALIEGTHQQRLDLYRPADWPEGTLFYEIDRNLWFVSRRSWSWTYVDADSSSGTTTLNIASTTGYAEDQYVIIGPGTAREETRRIASVTAGVSVTLTSNLANTHTAAQADQVAIAEAAWVFFGGIMRNTLANKPTGLTAADEGLLFHATNYLRTWRWTGSAWVYADGQREAKEIIWYPGSVPTGWALCDGSAVTVTLSDATTASFTTPNLVGKYPKGANAYTGTAVGATAPGLTGETADYDFAPITTNSSGSTGFGVTAGGTTFFRSESHTHTVDPPAHKHGVGTLAVDATGEPAHIDLVPIVKL